MKHGKLVEFLSNLYVNPPLHERKAPPHKRKAPLLKTLWRRFWGNIDSNFTCEMSRINSKNLKPRKIFSLKVFSNTSKTSLKENNTQRWVSVVTGIN